MSKDLVNKLRKLRSDAAELNRTLVTDLRPFLHSEDSVTFRLFPYKQSIKGDVTVGTTCTALMALAMNGQLEDFYGKSFAVSSAKRSFGLVVEAPWSSSGLDDDNAFTTTLILRAAGFLTSHDILAADASQTLKHNGKSLADVAGIVGRDIRDGLKIKFYPATTTLGYWFVDAVERLRLDMPAEFWSNAVTWAAEKFKEELSFVAAGQDAMMDPISMAMGACLAAKLRVILTQKVEPSYQEMLKLLPSDDRLEHGLSLLFKRQSASGIWPKYFPLFYYPKAGVNYCFSFELLEAVLNEFQAWPILETDSITEGLERAVSWCAGANRFKYTHESVLYCGWNSGSEIEPLRNRVPEAWATGVVHMFLRTLQTTLSAIIDRHVCQQRATVRPFGRDPKRWDDLVDTSVEIQNVNTSVLTVLQEHIVNPTLSATNGQLGKKQARSVLLFGPPGTSKTSIVRAVAEKLGWPLIELSPSDFLRNGMDKIFKKANQVFEDLSDLSKAVVFFDEMDAVAQNRQSDLDVTRQFLTTSMLPKIAALHDEARVLFFMATNHISELDPAITRPGRFDLLLFVGPPSWKDKLTRIDKILEDIGISDPDQIDEVKTLLEERVASASHPGIVEFLSLFTYGEFVSFLRRIRSKDDLLSVLKGMSKDNFHAEINEWANKLITLKEREPHATLAADQKTPRDEYEEDKHKSKIQY
jgi:hypothetical protein